jgi:hypothetical protein
MFIYWNQLNTYGFILILYVVDFKNFEFCIKTFFWLNAKGFFSYLNGNFYRDFILREWMEHTHDRLSLDNFFFS